MQDLSVQDVRDTNQNSQTRIDSIGLAFIYVLLFVAMQVVATVVVLVAFVVSALSSGLNLADPEILTQMTESVIGLLPWILLAANLLTILVGWGITRGRGYTLKEAAALRPLSWLLVVPTLLMGAGFSLGLNSLLALPLFSFASDSASTQAQSWLFGSLAMAIVASTITPIAEEIVFRGFILTELRRKLTPAAAILLQAIAFGIMHGISAWGVSAIMMGVLFAWVALRTRSVYASMLTHIGLNAASFIYVALMPDEPSIMLLIILAGAGLLVFVLCVGASMRLTSRGES